MYHQAVSKKQEADVSTTPALEQTACLTNLQDPGDMANCHSVRYRLHGPSIKLLQQNFATMIAEMAVQSSVEEFVRAELYVEHIPAAADSSVAARRRDAELTRPVHVDPGWRAVVLAYECGTADLIVTAQRILINSLALCRAAEYIINGIGQPLRRNKPAYGKAPSGKGPGPLKPLGSHSQLSWCVNSALTGKQHGKIQVSLATGIIIDPALLIVATALMLAKYGNEESPFIATNALPSQEEPEINGGQDDIRFLSICCGQGVRPSEMIASVRRTLASPLEHTTANSRSHSDADSNHPACVGLFLSTLPGESSEMNGLEEYLPFQAPPYPITILLAADSRQKINLECDYVGNSFDKEVLRLFTTSIAQIYLTLFSESEIDASTIEVLSSPQREYVATIGRTPSISCHDPRGTVQHAFEHAAKQWPSAVALRFGNESLSYRQLEEYANQVARVLQDCGVRTGERVGVCMERSLELVIFLLGTLKAGGSYVPMEPAYPLERIAYMTQDADVKVVVTSKPDFPAGDSVQVMTVEQMIKSAAAQSRAPIQPASTSEDVAYIIYTSGSTGRPKGVAIPHRNVLSLIGATQEDFALSPGDNWTFFHSAAFDFSVWEIWGSLLTGGSLVVVPYWVSRSPSEFLELLKTERVTVLNQTPSAFAQLIDADRASPSKLALRLVIFGGEPLNPRMLLPWFDRHPETRCRLVNMFGITETTVHVTAETISRDHALKASRSVGRPIPGWHVYVMDPKGHLLPPGVPGEIYVGGAGVALYYVNRPDLTAERFVPDPYGMGRIYRSGDKGRLLPDGRLEHLGRLDSQVKIRGFRIELSEIQAVLLDVPGVTAAAVVLHQEDPADAATARLNAYVVMEAGGVDEIRRHTKRLLPEYMMPSSIMLVSSLPLTSNGKLDISRLPRPLPVPAGPVKVDDESVAKQTEDWAGLLQQIWQKVLKVPIGLDDNFFDFGGNSLYAVRIAAAMREKGMPAIPLRDLYVHQTIRRITNALQAKINRSPA